MREIRTSIAGPSVPQTQRQQPTISGGGFQPAAQTDASTLIARLGQGLGIYASQKARQDVLEAQRRQQIQSAMRSRSEQYNKRVEQLNKQRGDQYRLSIQQLQAESQNLTGVARYQAQRQIAILTQAGASNPQLPMEDRQWAATRNTSLNKDNTQFLESIRSQAQANQKGFIKRFSGQSIGVATSLIDDDRIAELGSAQSIDDFTIRQILQKDAQDWLITLVDRELITDQQAAWVVASDEFQFTLDTQAAKHGGTIRKRAVQLQKQAAKQSLENATNNILEASFIAPQDSVKQLKALGYSSEQALDKTKKAAMTRLQTLPPTTLSFARLKGSQLNPLLAIDQTEFGNLVGAQVDRFLSNKANNYSTAEKGNQKLLNDVVDLAQQYNINVQQTEQGLKFAAKGLQTFSRQLAQKLNQSFDNAGIDFRMQVTQPTPATMATMEHAQFDFQNRSFISMSTNTTKTGLQQAAKAWAVGIQKLDQVGILGGVTKDTIELYTESLDLLQQAQSVTNPVQRDKLLKEAYSLGGIADGKRSFALPGQSQASINRITRAFKNGSAYDIHWASNFMANNSRAKRMVFQNARKSGQGQEFIVRSIFEDYLSNGFLGVQGVGALQEIRTQYAQKYQTYRNAYDNLDMQDYKKSNQVVKRIGTKYLQGYDLDPTAMETIAVSAVARSKINGRNPLGSNNLKETRDSLLADGWKFYRTQQNTISLTKSPFAISPQEQKAFLQGIERSTRHGVAWRQRQGIVQLSAGPQKRKFGQTNTRHAKNILRLGIARIQQQATDPDSVYGSQPQDLENLMRIMRGDWPNKAKVSLDQTAYQLRNGGVNLTFDFIRLDGSHRQQRIYLTQQEFEQLSRVSSTTLSQVRQQQRTRQSLGIFTPDGIPETSDWVPSF